MTTVGSTYRADRSEARGPRGQWVCPTFLSDRSMQTDGVSECPSPTADRPAAPGTRVLSFGPFRLLPTQRLLLEGEKRVRLGSRALDILIALVERAGELVSKKQLMAHVWPDTVVEEGNLKVHIAALRRTLGDGQAGHRYLDTIPGRGYCFVAPVIVNEEPSPPTRQVAASKRPHKLPETLTRLIGHTDNVTNVEADGFGRTAVALATAETLIANYEDGVWLIDLAGRDEPRLVRALAAALGPETPLTGFLAFLSDKQILLVLDNCEQIIQAVSALKGELGVRVLAISREPPHEDGEHV